LTTPDAFDGLTNRIAAGIRETPGLTGLILLGSASGEGAGRRDEWSDHDFFVLTEPGRGVELRQDLTWLPDADRIVLVAREGDIGFVVVYDDGHVFEFAYSDAEELSGALVGDATVLIDDEHGSAAALVQAARRRAQAQAALDPAKEVRLVLVKLLIGIGRIRRGELLAGNQLLRGWAVNHLVRAVRGRFPASSTGPDATDPDTIDPLRRFDRDFPDWAAQIATALDSDAEQAGRNLLDLVRRRFEPGWDEFPTAAADAIASRLGYTAPG
jgi:hypothetical protein